MTADHFTETCTELPLIYGMTACVVVFGWRSVRRRAQDRHFVSARLMFALGILIPAALFTLFRWSRLPTRPIYEDWEHVLPKIREAVEPLQLGLSACGVMFVIHTLLWILPKLKGSSAKAIPIPHEYSRSH